MEMPVFLWAFLVLCPIIIFSNQLSQNPKNVSLFRNAYTQQQGILVLPSNQSVIKEENLIRNLIEQQGIKKWGQVASILNRQIPNSERTPKQCRQRYQNFIKFKQNRDKLLIWSTEEEKCLFDLYSSLGSQWIQIARHFKSKSENSLKNKFYGSIRKLVRKLVTVGKDFGKFKKKPLKYESLMKVLEYNEISLKECQREHLQGLKRKILKGARDIKETIDQQQSLRLLTQITEFNGYHRSSNFQKKKLNNLQTMKNDKMSFQDQYRNATDEDAKDFDLPDLDNMKVLQLNHKESLEKKSQNNRDQQIVLKDLTFFELQKNDDNLLSRTFNNPVPFSFFDI